MRRGAAAASGPDLAKAYMSDAIPDAGPPWSIRWIGDVDGCLRIIDQTRLPTELSFVDLAELEAVREAIRSLQVRGAPAIGIAAAYGVVIGLRTPARQSTGDRPPAAPMAPDEWESVASRLASSRPTAVNLFWALQQMRQALDELPAGVSRDEQLRSLLARARRIQDDDRAMCRAIGRHGQTWFLERGYRRILTHCNTGGLATAEYGTALSVLFTLHDGGVRLHVWVDETRPLLQGARLTTWELLQRGIEATLICDSAAAHVMQQGWVDAVITGADRIAANGDAANKVGTYALAVLARAHGIPFYIAAPSSTFDLSIDSGDEIPIEERDGDEVRRPFGVPFAPAEVAVYNPAFDVTPAEYLEAIITERGVIRPVTAAEIRTVLGLA